MTTTQFQRLIRTDREHLVRKYAMMFAYETYRRRNPTRGDDAAFTYAERFWATYREKALDLLAIDLARAEQIEAN